MKVSAVAAMWMCAAFALFCFAFAASGFLEVPSITDPTERDDSIGYAAFWTFLGAVGVMFGALSWMIKEGKLGDPDRM